MESALQNKKILKNISDATLILILKESQWLVELLKRLKQS